MPSDEKKNNIIEEWFSKQPGVNEDDIPLLDAELIEGEEARAGGTQDTHKKDAGVPAPAESQLSEKEGQTPARLHIPRESDVEDETGQMLDWQGIVSILEDEAKTRGTTRDASVLFNSAGIILNDRLKQPRNAAIDFQNAFNIDFSFVPNLRSAIRLFYSLGNYQMALQLLQIIAQRRDIKNRTTILFEIAIIRLFYLNDPTGARDAITEALNESPSNVVFLNFLNNIYLRNRDSGELINLLEQLSHQRLNEHYLKSILFFMGRIFEERLNDPDMALKSYERIFLIDPSDSDAVRSIENILLAKRAYSEIVSILRQHSNSLPPERRIDVYNKIVQICKDDLQDTDSTISILQEILKIRPNDLSSLDLLLQQYISKNDYQQITAILKQISLLTTDKNILANIYFRLGTIFEEKLSDEIQAIEYYKKIVEFSTAYQPAYAALGRLLAKHGKWEDLVNLMEMEISQTEDNLQKVARYYKMAEIIELKIQDLNRAIGVYRKILQIRSSYLPALKALGTLYGKLGMHQELIDMFEEEIKITDDKEQIAFLLDKIGITYEERLNNKEKAADTYRRILDIIPDHLPTIRTLARLYARLGRWEDLIKMCEIESELIKDQIQIVSLLHKIGETYEEHLRDIDEAVRYYKKALMISPNYLPVLKSLGNIYLYQERYEELIDMYKRESEVTRNQPHNISLYHKIAQIYEDRLRMPERAIATYEEILMLDPYNLPALNALKNIYLKMQSYDRYIDILTREEHLVTDVTQKAYILYQIGEIYIDHLSNLNKGIEFLKRSITLNRENSNARILLLDSLRQNGRFSELADILIEFAGQQTTENDKIEIYWELSQIFYFKIKELNRAIMYLEKIIAIKPGYVRALMMLATIYREEKDFIKLITVLQKIVGLDLDTDLLVSYHLELAALKETVMKMPSESYIHYIKILEMQPDNQIAIDALERAYHSLRDAEGLSILHQNFVLKTELDREESVVHNFRLAVILLNNPRTSDYALSLLIEITNRQPEYLPAHILLREYYRQAGRFSEFVSESIYLSEHISNASIKKNVLTQAAIVLHERLNDTEGAIRLLTKAFDIAPADTSVFASLESLLISQNRGEDLISVYNRRVAAISDSRERASLYIRMAQLLEKDPGRIAEVIAAYKSAVAIDPYNESALIPLSNHLIATEIYDEAISCLTTLASSSRSQEVLKNTYLSLGTLLYNHRQDINGALINFQKVISIDPNNLPALEYMALIYYSHNNFEYALKTYQYLLSMNISPAKNLEYSYAIAGIFENNLSNIDGAIDVLKGVLKLDPTNEQLLNRLVSLCERGNRVEELLMIYENVIQSFEEHERINAIPLMIKRAEIYQNIQKSLKDAERELKRVIQIAPNNILAHAMLARLYSTDSATSQQAIAEYRILIQIDPFNIDNLRPISRLFNHTMQKDALFCTIGTLIALKSATNDEEFAYGESRHRIDAITGISIKNEDIDMNIVHHRARGLLREIISVINDDLNDIFSVNIEKYGPEVKRTRMTRKSNDRIRARCDDISRMFSIGDFNIFIADRQGVQSFVEPTDPPSLIIGGEYAKLPPDEQKFGFARMLYFIVDRQMAVASLSTDELQTLVNGILLLLSPERYSEKIKDEQSLNMAKRLNKSLSRRSKNILLSMQDRASELAQTDIKIFRKATFMSAGRLGLFVTSSSPSAISYLYRISAPSRQLPTSYDTIVQECNRNEEIRDIIAYSISEEFLRLREKTGLCIK